MHSACFRPAFHAAFAAARPALCAQINNLAANAANVWTGRTGCGKWHENFLESPVYLYGRVRAYFREVVDEGAATIDLFARHGALDLNGSQLGRAFNRAKLMRMHCDVGARIFVSVAGGTGEADRALKDRLFVSGWAYDLYKAFDVVTDALEDEEVDVAATLENGSPCVLFFKGGRRLHKDDCFEETDFVLFVLIRILKPLTELKEQYDRLVIKLDAINEAPPAMSARPGGAELTP